MTTRDADEEPSTANVIPVSRRSERVQAQLFAKLLRRDIETMKRKVVKAESAWQKRCESEGYVEPPKRLVIVRERLAEARRMLSALNARFPRT
ncbi:hypothetical protein A5658_10015 [Mycobacterium sp. 1245111.1]|uniref:hypothetical protein n=1 Tax=Mycobacterium sp. 1245111.1 TaxID=1834073 RepID=UPI00080225EA|nr:hypothetical protein [Mycobacterium sp. 1245111.1]OBK34922.1 hypothetical protein A5658_10015 [Mycobacterium sp. 1245111.1]